MSGQLSNAELYKLGMVFDAVAKLLPAQGRDYDLQVEFNAGQPAITVKGMTPVGIAFAEHCREHLATALKEVQDERR